MKKIFGMKILAAFLAVVLCVTSCDLFALQDVFAQEQEVSDIIPEEVSGELSEEISEIVNDSEYVPEDISDSSDETSETQILSETPSEDIVIGSDEDTIDVVEDIANGAGDIAGGAITGGTWRIDSAYKLIVEGDSFSGVPWSDNQLSIQTAYINAKPSECASLFSGCSNVTNITFGEKFDTSGITSMANMFNGCSKLQSVNLTKLNGSSVHNVGSMFYGCNSLQSINLSMFGAENLTYAAYGFYGCSSLTYLNLSGVSMSKLQSIGSCDKCLEGCKSLRRFITMRGYSYADLPKIEGYTWYDASGNPISLYLGSGASVELIARENETAPINVDINKTFLHLAVDEASTLKITYEPVDAVPYQLVWESTAPNVATVNSDGVVMGVSGGSCTILVKSVISGGVMFSCNVIVVERTPHVSIVNKYLYGFDADSDYLINGISVKTKNLYTIPIEDEWIGTTIRIVKLNPDPNYNSITQYLYISVICADPIYVEVAEPVFNETPATVSDVVISDNNLSCTSIEWNPVAERFAYGVTYSANVTLKAKEGYLLKKDYTKLFIGSNRTFDYSLDESQGTLTFTMSFPAVELKADEIGVEEIAPVVYTGSAITPDVTVYAKGKILSKGTDYTVSYKNNTNAADKTDKNAPTVVIKLLGNYSAVKGSLSKTFTIQKVDLSQYNDNFDLQNALTYERVLGKASNKVQKLKPVLKYNNKTLTSKDYTLSYPDTDHDSVKAYQTAGDYVIKITGTDKNFTGSFIIHEFLAEKLLTDTRITFANNKTSYEYTGSEITPTVIVKDSNNVVLDTDEYSVFYDSNVEIGTATVTIIGDKPYEGCIRKTFKITGKSLKSSMFTQMPTSKTKTYDQTELSYLEDVDYTAADGNKRLEMNKDYTLSYSADRRNVGTVQVIFTGMGAYTGTVKLKVAITPANINTTTLSVGTWDEQEAIGYVDYEKGGVCPIPVVNAGSTPLTYGKDFTCTYKNNKKVTKENDSTPIVIIKGKGNYKAEISVPFKIKAKNLADSSIVGSAKNVLLKDKNNNFKTTFTLTDGNKKKLQAKVDYDVTPIYYLKNAAGDYEKITAAKIPVGTANSELRIVISANAEGNYFGEKDITYLGYINDFSKAKIKKIANQTYTGSAIKPAVTVTYPGRETPLTEGTDYTVEYTNNVNKGSATVTVTGIGSYAGLKKATFKINAQSVNRILSNNPFQWLLGMDN